MLISGRCDGLVALPVLLETSFGGQIAARALGFNSVESGIPQVSNLKICGGPVKFLVCF